MNKSIFIIPRYYAVFHREDLQGLVAADIEYAVMKGIAYKDISKLTGISYVRVRTAWKCEREFTAKEARSIKRAISKLKHI